MLRWKMAPARDSARNRQCTLVTLDNHLADGESQPHSIWLRRNESIENGFSILRADTWTRVFDSDCDLVVGFPFRSSISARGPTS